MSRKLTPKQEDFCLAYVETGNASEAYRRVYNAEKMKPSVLKVKACELLKNGNVSVTIEKLRGQAAERSEITIDALVQELDEVRRKAMAENKGASGAVSAILGKAKLLGFLTDKHEHTGKSGKPLFLPPITNDMSDLEAAEAYAETIRVINGNT